MRSRMKNDNQKSNLDGPLFLQGETVKLMPPAENDFKSWAGWISDVETMRFLKHGKYPITELQQQEWYELETKKGRLVLMVRSREENQLLGVVSMSEVDFENGTASIAGVIPNKSPSARFAALESRAILMEHAFRSFGLRRLNSTQFYPGNLKWTAFQLLIGWTVESYGFEAIRKGRELIDVVNLSAHVSLFEEICASNNGSLWPGQEVIEKLRKSDSFREISDGLTALASAEKIRISENSQAILNLYRSALD